MWRNWNEISHTFSDADNSLAVHPVRVVHAVRGPKSARDANAGEATRMMEERDPMQGPGPEKHERQLYPTGRVTSR